MTSSSCLFCAVAIWSLALSAPASAQPTATRDHRGARTPPPGKKVVVVALKVDAMSPQSGKPGTRVTLTGSGFTRSTEIWVGGRKVPVASFGAKELTFTVPRIDSDAEVVIRRGQRDVRAGLFQVLIAPSIRRIAPASGAPGTRVEIVGRGFRQGDTITVGRAPAAVVETSPSRLVITVPEGATSDFIHLGRAGGEKAKSSIRFRVLSPPPVVTGMAPASGPPGTRVRLSGTGFTATDRVSYGRVPTRVIGRGAGWVDIEVPAGARKTEHFQVAGPGGRASAAQPFQLVLPPVVSRFAPRQGAAGTQLEVFGRNFQGGDWVSLSGKRLPVVQLRKNQITVKIPPGALSGEVAIGRGPTAIPARGRFEVLTPPALGSFVPARGGALSRVTLNGSHLVGGKVFYGSRPVRVIESRGQGVLVVEVPAGARDEVFRVVTKGGEAVSARPFHVLHYAVVSDAKPRQTTLGTTLTVFGRNLDKVERFELGGQALKVASRDANSATLEVVGGAQSGPLTWISHGHRDKSTFRIQVVSPPSFAAFSPNAGPTGTRIIIRGAHFDRRTRVYFGATALKIAKLSPNEIIAVVPPRTGGHDYLYLKGYGAKVRSTQKFEVRVPPVITGAAPAEAHPGEQVTIQGRWLTDGTEILFGSLRARVLRRNGDSIRVVVPPAAAPGPIALVAKTGTLQSTARRPFMVLGSASITGFSPPRAMHGHQVKVDGARLGSDVKIWFGSVELPIVKRKPNGRSVWVVIPDTASGIAHIEVESAGKRARSAGQLTIEAPPPGKVKVRDHRGPKRKR